MAEIEYPVHMYKNLCMPKYAHDRKSMDAMTLDGWTNVRANIGPQIYPRGMFHPETREAVVVGDYGKDGVIDLERAKAEEQSYRDRGYTEKAVAPLMAVAPQESAAPRGSLTRLDQLETDMADLKGSMAEILEALTGKTKRKKSEDAA